MSHLLRRAFEEAADYAAALRLLTDDGIEVAMPALITLSGIAPDEGCVIEAIGRRRIVHYAALAPGSIVGVANDWLSPDLPGKSRDCSLPWSNNATPKAGNRERRGSICRLQSGSFLGACDLSAPVLNGHTGIVAVANASTGRLYVEALDPGDDRRALPQVVASTAIQAVA